MKWLRTGALVSALAALALAAACNNPGVKSFGDRIVNADAEPGNWLSYGRDYREQRFSPLNQITTANVNTLGLAWSYDLDEPEAVESTPLVVDGVMYVTSGWSKVFALDIRTGKELWKFDPEVDRAILVDTCCNAVNRGVAYWNGKVYLGALDGRLIALDAKTGKPVWSTQTVDRKGTYTITGAPRVAKGKVFIGNGGADMAEVRGYVSAYDAETGKQAWRFWAVPDDPKKGFESKAMEMAAKTWTGEWWKHGGGGTAWDSIVYDPELDLLYVGFGNGAPWNRKIRSPGGGDNLFLASIVAMKPETGEYVWHYQVNPGESWDYSATMPMMLATLKIDGADRKVLMQTPKNGFFYVIDRTTGKVISATPHASINWAKGIDLATGRPIENPEVRFPDGKPVVVQPSAVGAANWQPMAFNPNTGLIYFQSRNNAGVYADLKEYKLRRKAMNRGEPRDAQDDPLWPGPWPQPASPPSASLVGWDPVKKAEVWRVPVPQSRGAGVLATAGNLVFQGTGEGLFKAYDGASGKELWSYDVQNPVGAPPISFGIDGEQYIAVAVGWGYPSLIKGPVPHPQIAPNTNRVLVFKLGGDKVLPPVQYEPETLPPPPTEKVSDEAVARGARPYAQYCSACHGGGAAGNRSRPDLRYSPYLASLEFWNGVVRDGDLKAGGMAGFGDALTPEQIADIRAYVIRQAQTNRAAMSSNIPHSEGGNTARRP